MINTAPANRLTDRQQEIFDFIVGTIGTRGYGPTFREIGEHTGINTTNGVFGHLNALQKKGYIIREPNLSRAIQINPEFVDTPEERLKRFSHNGRKPEVWTDDITGEVKVQDPETLEIASDTTIAGAIRKLDQLLQDKSAVAHMAIH